MATTIFESHGAVATFQFNRPEARNAMTWEMYDGLVEACERVDRDDAIRVLVLSGAGGRAFVAGTDIGQFTSFSSAQDALEYEARIGAVINRLETLARPTIAAL